ncbi:hypothetical protein IW262DRAFT_1420045 [Armillaria fumosa]|nr:hypothetical protein IW262DRAFT_1420045 [Armillaria fumosa]
MLPSIRQLDGYLLSSSTVQGGGEASESGGDEPKKKKKRRRQALSCTECKHHKIRCNRMQPCVPCTRRGEQSKCVWNVIELPEKYLTRAEHDELNARVDHLEVLVKCLTQSQAQAWPQPQFGPLPPFILPPPLPKNWEVLTFLVLGGCQCCSRCLPCSPHLRGTPAPDPLLIYPTSTHIPHTRLTHIPVHLRCTRLILNRRSLHWECPHHLLPRCLIHHLTCHPHHSLGTTVTPGGGNHL